MYYLLHFIVKGLSYLPFRVMYVLSDLMYYLLYYVIRYRRKVVRKNLTESFPDKNPDEIIRIEKRFYHYFMDLILECIKLASISREEIRKRMVFVNSEEVNAKFREGKNITAFIGHFGNWEWMTSAGLWFDDNAICVQVYHALVNGDMDRLMKQMRERMGKNVCVEMRKTARFVNNMANEGKPFLMALIADQSPKRRDIKHYVTFLNHDVPVIVGPEKMTKHYDYAPFFVSVHRVKRGYYEMRVSSLHEDATSLPDYELTDLYFRRLEEEIRQQPECYLWTHNRFKYARE